MFVCFTFLTGCCAQSTNLRTVFNQVNQTLKDYAIGTMDFYPSYFSMAEGARYTFKRLSIDYPNIVFSYKIEYPSGTATFVSEGVYKVLIPLNSLIAYPSITKSATGISTENKFGVSISHENGIQKSKNGVSTLMAHFEIYGDSELTIKKFYRELKELQKIVQSEGFRGKLEITTKRNRGVSTRKASTATPKEKNSDTKQPINSNKQKKVGKYVQ